jgi:hypothetical protein
VPKLLLLPGRLCSGWDWIPTSMFVFIARCC